jgi:hypothetical protein
MARAISQLRQSCQFLFCFMKNPLLYGERDSRSRSQRNRHDEQIIDHSGTETFLVIHNVLATALTLGMSGCWHFAMGGPWCNGGFVKVGHFRRPYLLPRCYQDRTTQLHLKQCQEHPVLWFVVGLGWRLDFGNFANRGSHSISLTLTIDKWHYQ